MSCDCNSRRLAHPDFAARPGRPGGAGRPGGGGGKRPPRPQPGGIQWPSFKGQTQLVGTSSLGVSVYCPAKAQSGTLQNAKDLLADADRVTRANAALFGYTAGADKINVIVFALGKATDGTGGADHMGCTPQSGGNIEVDASWGASMRCSALFEAELSEAYMGGDLCGYSTGEALSRWCASSVSSNALADFASAPTWQKAGMPDFVNKTDPTDSNMVSVGCGMAFLSWLMSAKSPKKVTLAQVAQAMVQQGQNGTLAGLYAALVLQAPDAAWGAFQAALAGVTITSDDPFGAGV